MNIDQPPMASSRLRADHPTVHKVPYETSEEETPDKRKVWKLQVRQQVALFSVSVQQFTVHHQDKHTAKLKPRACMTGYLARHSRHLLIKA